MLICNSFGSHKLETCLPTYIAELMLISRNDIIDRWNELLKPYGISKCFRIGSMSKVIILYCIGIRYRICKTPTY